MRFVVVSDIHANYEALEGILADVGDLEIDRYVSLGDLVGYYAEPQECIDRFRGLNGLCIQGNHDAVASGIEEPLDFNPLATDRIFWTRGQLRPESKKWLAELPTQGKLTEDIWAVHGSLRNRDEYLMSQMVIQANFFLMEKLQAPRTVLFGHTHRRAVYRLDGTMVTTLAEKRFRLREENRYLINPGGSGQPRDGEPGAPYLMIDDDRVELRRAPYDVEAAAAKVAKLPYGDILADRLRQGI